MEDIYTPSITFSLYKHEPNNVVLEKVFGYVVHAMSEFIHKDALKYLKDYDKVNHILYNVPFENYPEWLEADYWLHLCGYSCTSFIMPDGTLKVCKAMNHKAYHAGVSRFKNMSNLNGKFMGSEVLLEGKNDYGTFIRRINNENWVSVEQYKTLAWEINKAMNDYHFDLENVVAHSEIAGDDVRGKGKGKVDPGLGFDWEKLYYYINSFKGI
jgi:hypothetical protein